MLPVVFDEEKINEISDRYLPKAGKTLSRVSRDSLLLSMTSEISNLIVPPEQPESVVVMNSINGTLDAALPEPGMLLGKMSRRKAQNEILLLIKIQFEMHNENVHSATRKSLLDELSPKVDTQSVYPSSRAEKITKIFTPRVLFIAAGAAVLLFAVFKIF